MDNDAEPKVNPAMDPDDEPEEDEIRGKSKKNKRKKKLREPKGTLRDHSKY